MAMGEGSHPGSSIPANGFGMAMESKAGFLIGISSPSLCPVFDPSGGELLTVSQK